MDGNKNFGMLKQKLINENEQKYGAEVREKYGSSVVDASNEKFKNMTMEQYYKAELLSKEVNDTLYKALIQGNPASELAQKACDLHRQWLCVYWPDGMYTKETHMELVNMYCADERFKAYYDAISPGAAEFLREAMSIYCK